MFTRILLAVLLITCIHTIYFGITSVPFCYEIEASPGKTIKFYYQAAGDFPQQTQVNITNGQLMQPIIFKGVQNLTELSANTVNRLCFVSTDGGYKSVSVQFYTLDKAHLLELAKKSEISELHKKVISVGEGILDASKSQLFTEQRQIINANIIMGHEDRVKNYAILKLVAIIVVAVGQFLLLKKLLDKQGYQPVSM